MALSSNSFALAAPVGGIVILALRLGKAFEPEFGAVSHVDFSLQRHIAAVGFEEFSLRFSNEPDVNYTVHDNSHLLHRILVRQGIDRQFAEVCKGNKAAVEQTVNVRRWQSSEPGRDSSRHLAPTLSPIEAERVFRVSNKPLPSESLSRLSRACQRLISSISAWERCFLGTERFR
jgi:hypothetical protein